MHAPGRKAVLWPKLGIRYGMNSRWTTELLVSFIGPSLHEPAPELLELAERLSADPG